MAGGIAVEMRQPQPFLTEDSPVPKMSWRVLISLLTVVAITAGAWAGTRYAIDATKGDVIDLKAEVDRINRDGTKMSIEWTRQTNQNLGDIKAEISSTKTEVKGLRETVDARFDALEKRLDDLRRYSVATVPLSGPPVTGPYRGPVDIVRTPALGKH